MPDFNVFIQVEAAISARSQKQAEERAEQYADSLRIPRSPLGDKKVPRWWPEDPTIEVTDIQDG